MKVQRHLRLLGATGRLRTGVFQGRDHVVVPVVALMEGVIWPSNAEAPEYVPATELTALGWDGRPVMYGHPAENGAQVPANTPRRLEATSFGQVFSTAIRDRRLEMEAWLDPGRAAQVPGADQLLARLRNGETVEVSVGVFVNAESAPGSFDGRSYQAVWRGIVPDHLAFLPEGDIGACSVEMGCGALRHLERTAMKSRTAEEWKAYWDAMPASLKKMLDDAAARPTSNTPTLRAATDNGTQGAPAPIDLTARLRANRDLPLAPDAVLRAARASETTSSGETVPSPDLNAYIRAARGLTLTPALDAVEARERTARLTSAQAHEAAPPPPDLHARIRAASDLYTRRPSNARIAARIRAARARTAGGV